MSDNSASETSPMHALQDQPCGHALTAARLKKNLSIEAAAQHLKLSIKQVQCLEVDDYPNKQISTFHKGYLKRYCAWLELNLTQLLDSLQAHGYQMAQPPVYYRSESVRSHQNHLGGQTRLFNHSRTTPPKRALWRMTLISLIVFWGITQWLMHGDLTHKQQDIHVIHAQALTTPKVMQPQTLATMLDHAMIQPAVSPSEKPTPKAPTSKVKSMEHDEGQDDG